MSRGDEHEVTRVERDEDRALKLTALLVDWLRGHGLRGSVGWDGCELLVSWSETSDDE